MKLLVFIVLHGLMINQLFSQEALPSDTLKVKDFKIVPLPVIGANPTSGWMFGIAPSATWYMGEEKHTSISSALGSVIYTTNKQLITTAKANTYFSGNRWNMLTDLRYFISSQPTYGLGTGPQSAKPIADGDNEFNGSPYKPLEISQMLEFSFFRLHNTLVKRYKETYAFAGLGYHLDYHYNIQDNLLDLDTIPSQITSHYAYSNIQGFNPNKYALSGISLNFLYDSRDNVVNPYAGRMAFANIHINPTFLGSSKNSTILWLEYRDYIHLNPSRPRHLIGFWTYGVYIK